MDQSKRKIAFIAVGLVVLVSAALIFKHYSRSRAIEQNINRQMEALRLPSSQEIYSAKFFHKCYLASYKTPILDTYCQFVGTRFYEFDISEVDYATEQLKGLLETQGFRQRAFNQLPDNIYDELQSANTPQLSGEFVSIDHPLINSIELTCYKPHDTSRVAHYFYIGDSPIPGQISTAMEDRVNKTTGVIVCGFIIEAGNYIFK